ncbi:hypothetical protein V1477_001011 [Vespula maculifrons]|uniref:Uncharacterized protein n=1 Tax=Vespula maculifrons TaxID=7453 RepID=A0ABD2D0K0_VESMC
MHMRSIYVSHSHPKKCPLKVLRCQRYHMSYPSVYVGNALTNSTVPYVTPLCGQCQTKLSISSESEFLQTLQIFDFEI